MCVCVCVCVCAYICVIDEGTVTNIVISSTAQHNTTVINMMIYTHVGSRMDACDTIYCACRYNSD